jgi:hypothetical protein
MNTNADDDLVTSLARALQPLVAHFQDAGIGVGEWVEAIKVASYHAAREATDAEWGRAVFTRMSVRTGMTRTELQRLRRQLSPGNTRARKIVGQQRTARVIDGWHTNPRYLDDTGQPRPLPLEGVGDCVHTLIRQYAGDVPSSSVLSELHRQGLLIRHSRHLYRPQSNHRQASLLRADVFEQLMSSLCDQLEVGEAESVAGNTGTRGDNVGREINQPLRSAY